MTFVLFYALGVFVALWSMAVGNKNYSWKEDAALFGASILWPVALAYWMREVGKAAEKINRE